MTNRQLLTSLAVTTVIASGCGGASTHSSSATSPTPKAATRTATRLHTVCKAVTDDLNVLQRDEGALNGQIAGHAIASGSVRRLLSDLRAAREHAAQLTASVRGQRGAIRQYMGSLATAEKAAREISRHDLSGANSDLIAASDQAGPFSSQLDQMCSA